MGCAYINVNQEGGSKNNKMVNDLFREIIGKKPTVVLYFANWCGHCNDMKPHWNKATDDLKMEKMINPKKVIHGDFNKYVIALEDGSYDKKKCPDVDQNVQGFPTINYYPDNKGALESFDEARDEEHLKKWLNNKLNLGSVQSQANQTGGKRRRRRKRKTRKTKRRRKRKTRKTRKTKRRRGRKSRKSKRSR
tara:strand:- start:1041 stop:1616 length:576 start_codon:yes stop_codon:yes gene_type:complete